MSDSEPRPVDLRLLRERIEQGDVEWVRSRLDSGDLDWLQQRMGTEQFGRFRAAAQSGDVAALRRHLATLEVSPRRAAVPVEAVRSENRSLIIAGIVIAALLGSVLAFLLLRNNDDDDREDTLAVSDTSVVPSSLPVTVISSIVSSATSVAPDTVPTTLTTLDAAAPEATASPPAAAAPSVAPVVPVTASAPAPLPSSPGTAAVSSPASPTTSLPTVDLLTLANRSSTFSRYLEMTEAAGLTDQLTMPGARTIFAPTESAFTDLPVAVQAALRSPANRDVLARIVRYSTISQRLPAAQLATGALQTLEGSPVNVRVSGTAVTVNDAIVTGTDVLASNGVLHAIDRLLVPPGLDLTSIGVAPTTLAAPTSAVSQPTTTR